MSLNFSNLTAQEETPKKQMSNWEFEEEREKIRKEERAMLRAKVEKINKDLEAGKISTEKAEELKMQEAEKHAKNIENRIAILEAETELQTRNREFSRVTEDSSGKNKSESKELKYDRRTTNDLVIAAGFNNALEEGQSLNDSDFKLAGSRFFEIGWAWKTRVFERSNWLRLRYGFSFQFNGLKPTDNRIFTQEDNETFLVPYNIDLDKSKFRMDNLVVPVHFEFGPSSKYEGKNHVRYSTENKLKIGVGGYAGFNIGQRQKLKYEVEGEKVKEKLKNNYNTNDMVYGLSGYIGWGWATLYGKYDLNPIFKDPNRELHNFSLGLRFDVD